MNQYAIQIENLSKQYQIGQLENMRQRDLRTVISDTVKSPFRRARALLRGEAYGAIGADKAIWALNDINLTVEQGEVVGIIGKNGAGKSTLLKILSRITKPTSGRARLQGRVGALLEVGTGFHLDLTGRENVYLNGAILGMSRGEITRKFDEIIAFSGVEQFIDTPVKFYSSGMRLRLGFAVAAHLEPDILVVDEVLAVGDAEFQKKCIGKMNDVSNSGRTVLFVSHNMAAVENLCSRAVLLEQGQVVADGAVTEIIAQYLRSAQTVGTYLGDVPRSSGAFDPVIQSLTLKNSVGVTTDTVRAGEHITFALEYTHDMLLSGAQFGIIVNGANGMPLFFLQTYLHEGVRPNMPKSGILECTVPKLPLMNGEYTVSLGCASDGKQLDMLEHCARFQVTSGDFFGTGELPPRASIHGPMLVDATWTLPQIQGDPTS